jgi:HAD superfamily hydrolase (TIGR01509 family)
VLFDFDGTLTRPGALDFDAIRRAIACPARQPVLEFIAGLPEAAERQQAMQRLESHEMAAAEASQPTPGVEELLHWLKRQGLRLGIISRNGRASIERALENFQGLRAEDFDLILTRDDPLPPKPQPDGIRHAAHELGVGVAEVLVVGDFLFDILAGHRAGAITVFLDTGRWPAPAEADMVITALAELKGLLRLRLPLPAGKLPNELLEEILHGVVFDDPAVLINPGIGEDIAAVSIAGEEVLILKSDPITFATDAIGQYAVLVNANDIATSGATPRWMLTTLLFPCGVTPAFIREVILDLSAVCRRWGITLCGGHTEITDAVSRPLVAGTMAGTVRRERLIDKRDMRPGDRILLTKAIAVEGTAIIAREFGARLQRSGMSNAQVDACRRLLDQIGILEEARIAAACPDVSAMHDVTEGGLATALSELSIAGGHRLRVQRERIPLLTETEEVCSRLGIDPLGLIGSGSLLICCRPPGCALLTHRLVAAGLRVSDIGEVLESGRGVDASEHGSPVVWPSFAADEITRLF